jgi:hypothetical protein
VVGVSGGATEVKGKADVCSGASEEGCGVALGRDTIGCLSFSWIETTFRVFVFSAGKSGVTFALVHNLAWF